ncbi:acyltransferase family protein [Escherichia coli]|uniref:acyltransferase family protein n=1 Tax=Escherichia coli TaxID=562 RepID=UPI002AD75C54|nr:acyltransferase [Escherichia coli]MDZ9502562.1 acyltransferase family protein [Escherichia coli]
MTLNNKNLDIQALRAVAIIMVILQHYRNRLPSPDWYLSSFNYVNYWAGVDIFLAISGYLMAKSLTGEIKKPAEQLKHFYYFYLKEYLG